MNDPITEAQMQLAELVVAYERQARVANHRLRWARTAQRALSEVSRPEKDILEQVLDSERRRGRY